jgi:hypothetical protein
MPWQSGDRLSRSNLRRCVHQRRGSIVEVRVLGLLDLQLIPPCETVDAAVVRFMRWISVTSSSSISYYRDIIPSILDGLSVHVDTEFVKIMATGLRYVIAMPCGGGKTTTCDDGYYLDIDAMYTLRETQTTYDRMNNRLQTMAKNHSKLPMDVISEHQERLQNYEGNAECLLVHSLDVAKLGGLHLKAILVPSEELHEQSIASRAELSKWIARRNRATLISRCAHYGESFKMYDTWATLEAILKDLRDVDSLTESPSRKDSLFSAEPTIKPSAIIKAREDEEFLLHLVASGLGCPFEENSSDRLSQHGEAGEHSWLRLTHA